MPHIGGENIESDTGRIIGVATANELGLISGKYLFSSGDVLYSKIRPNLNKVAVPSFSGICSADIYPLRPNSERLSRDFLAHLLRSRDFLAYTEKHSSRTNIPKLNRESLLSYEAILPPLAEQRRIAEVLDRAEALQAKRRAALALLDPLTQAIFLDLFGDPEARGWPMATIADIAHPSSGSIRTGPFGSQLLHSEFVDEGVAVLGIDNAVANEFRWAERRFISEVKYRELKRYTVRPGDVLITIMGTCGRCAVVPDEVPVAINTKHLCCVTLQPKKCLPSFLHAYFLLHPLARRYLDRTTKGAIMAGLNMGIIKAMPIPIPPLPIQRAFARQAAAVEKLKTAHRASLAELDALFAALQHRAFRGEL